MWSYVIFLGLPKSIILTFLIFNNCEVSDDIPIGFLFDLLATPELLLHFFIMFFFFLPLVLNEGYSQDFDYNRDVAQCIHKPKFVRHRYVLLENLADQAHLVCKCDEDLRLVEMFLEVLREQILELWEHCIEHINHQEQNLEGNVLPILIMFNYIRIVEALF